MGFNNIYIHFGNTCWCLGTVCLQPDDYQVSFQAPDLKDIIENNMLLKCCLTVVKSPCPSYSNSFLSFPHNAVISLSSRSAGTLRHEGLSDLGLYTSLLLFHYPVNRPCEKYTLIFQKHVRKCQRLSPVAQSSRLKNIKTEHRNLSHRWCDWKNTLSSLTLLYIETIV